MPDGPSVPVDAGKLLFCSKSCRKSVLSHRARLALGSSSSGYERWRSVSGKFRYPNRIGITTCRNAHEILRNRQSLGLVVEVESAECT